MSGERLALEIEGWLELGLPDRALERVQPLLEQPGTRQLGLRLRVEALIELQRHAEALTDLDELTGLQHDPDWVDLKQGWCRKRTGDLPGAVAALERMVARSHRSALAHYNLACYLALLGQTERALDEVAMACGLNPTFREQAMTETDLDSLRSDPRFQVLLPPPPSQ